jgi:hypothetical protein
VIAAVRAFEPFTRSCHKSPDFNESRFIEGTHWQQQTYARPRQACVHRIKSCSCAPEGLQRYHNLNDTVDLVSDLDILSLPF